MLPAQISLQLIPDGTSGVIVPTAAALAVLFLLTAGSLWMMLRTTEGRSTFLFVSSLFVIINIAVLLRNYLG